MEDEDVKPFTQAGPSRRRAPEIHVEREELMVFLHALMRVGMVSLIKAQEWQRKLIGTVDSLALDHMLESLNEGLRHADMVIRKFKYPLDGKDYLGIVNTVADPPSKLSSTFDTEQRAFIRVAVELIARSGTTRVPDRELLNVGSVEVPRVDENGAVKGVHRVAMKPETVERLLKTLEEELWLARDGGQCTFGPRSLLELRGVVEAMEDVSDATLKLLARCK